jgi:hypothetical protein
MGEVSGWQRRREGGRGEPRDEVRGQRDRLEVHVLEL